MSVILQFSNTDSLVSKLVQWRTGSWASHVDFVTARDTLIGADWKSGVVEKPFDPANYEQIERYRVEGIENYQVEELMRSQLGKSYDFGAIFGFLARTHKLQDESKWFCSELIAWAFLKAGKPLLKNTINVSTIAPSHLLMSPLLEPY